MSWRWFWQADPELSQVARLRRRNAELELLIATLRDLNSTLSVEQMVERLLERALGHLESDGGSVMLQDDDGRLRIEGARGIPREVMRESRIRLGEGIAGYVAATGETVYVEDIESDPRFSRPNQPQYTSTSCISVPLPLESGRHGVLNVHNKRGRKRYAPTDAALLEALGHEAGTALGKARRYEQVLRSVQRDPVTGLADGSHLAASLEVELNRARRYRRPLAAVMIEIDRLGAPRERQPAPDPARTLQSLALLLSEQSRVHDIVARYGEAGFVAVLPETRIGGGIRFAEKIRAELQAAAETRGSDEKLTVSVGISSYPEDGRTASELLRAAEGELARVRQLGGDLVSATRKADAGA